MFAGVERTIKLLNLGILLVHFLIANCVIASGSSPGLERRKMIGKSVEKRLIFGLFAHMF